MLLLQSIWNNILMLIVKGDRRPTDQTPSQRALILNVSSLDDTLHR